jgi:hypothetical protein
MIKITIVFGYKIIVIVKITVGYIYIYIAIIKIIVDSSDIQL